MLGGGNTHKNNERISDHGRDQTCYLLISELLLAVKRLAIGPRGRLMAEMLC